MTYAFLVDAPMPVEMYDAVHAAAVSEAGESTQGLLVHVAWATATGFEVVEVWESKADADRFNAEVLGPVMARLAGDHAPPQGPVPQEFDVRGLVIPAAGLVV